MRIAVLCPGPSLKEYLRAPVRHDVTIAVNQAVRAGLCDWWCFGDAEAYWKCRAARHGAKCFTSRQSLGRIVRSAGGNDQTDAEKQFPIREIAAATVFEEIGTAVPWDTNWHRHSMTAAMVLAEWLARWAGEPGAELAIYGVDWSGTDYFDGPADPGQAVSEQRWKAEEHAFGRVAAILIAGGMQVNLRRAVAA